MRDEVTLVAHTGPDQLREGMSGFVDYYNRERCHEALRNVTPDDVRFGRTEAILNGREQLAIRALVARREHCGRAVKKAKTPGTRTPGVLVSASPDLSR